MKILNHFKKVEATSSISASPNKLEPIKDAHTLPYHPEDFKSYHIKVLRRLNKHSIKEPFSGLMTLEVDIPNFIPILLNLKLIRISKYQESLTLLKADNLKSILKGLYLKSTGKKQELIDLLLSRADESMVKSSSEYSDFYLLTEAGKELIDNSYSDFQEKEKNFIDSMVELIQSNRIDDAYRLICKKNAENPVPTGMNVDWMEWYYNGIPASQKSIYLQCLNSSSNKLSTALAIYCDISGESGQRIKNQYANILGTKNDVLYNLKLISTIKNVDSYINSGIEKYQFLSILDADTCPVCGKLDGKIFKLKDLKIGVNCPPMHDGCRCTTTISPLYSCETSMRFARDRNNKGIMVPASMTWNEWKEIYLKQEKTQSKTKTKMTKEEIYQFALECEELARKNDLIE
ncbi:MAG: minor capsid protein [Lachnospiraceae bacterium]|nr:minor capsid protein [Lachnospiraceae bacterium]